MDLLVNGSAQPTPTWFEFVTVSALETFSLGKIKRVETACIFMSDALILLEEREASVLVMPSGVG
jgi:hypothetical protein